MNTLPPNAFVGKTETPADADLSKALGSAKPVWDRLIADLAAQYDVANWEWKCYSSKTGWSLRLKRGKRTIYGWRRVRAVSRVLFILGEKAIQAGRQTKLSLRVLRLIDEAERYPEGAGIRLHIKSGKDIPAVKQLTEMKLLR